MNHRHIHSTKPNYRFILSCIETHIHVLLIHKCTGDYCVMKPNLLDTYALFVVYMQSGFSFSLSLSLCVSRFLHGTFHSVDATALLSRTKKQTNVFLSSFLNINIHVQIIIFSFVLCLDWMGVRCPISLIAANKSNCFLSIHLYMYIFLENLDIWFFS